tara:strand:+ start:791 stop:913 length:123 start_codon:yes stop_codon:yes gene_type:complete
MIDIIKDIEVIEEIEEQVNDSIIEEARQVNRNNNNNESED